MLLAHVNSFTMAQLSLIVCMQDVTAVAALSGGPAGPAVRLGVAQRASKRRVRISVLDVLGEGVGAKAATRGLAALDIAETLTVKVAHLPGRPLHLPSCPAVQLHAVVLQHSRLSIPGYQGTRH